MNVKRQRKKAKVKLGATATARVEAVAKVAYSRKRTTTEIIPPDVTRAKANRWLDLISPITEWAGLKSDALAHRRQQLRIQQEDSLLRLANELRRKLEGHDLRQPVPLKILVPSLEKASMEDPSDQVMIERWANLLASATQEVPVQPRFVGILGELAGTQAECLEHIAFHHVDGIEFPARDFEEAPLEFADHISIPGVRKFVGEKLKTTVDLNAVSKSLAALFLGPGLFLVIVLWDDPLDTDFEVFEGYDNVAATGVRRDDDLAVLESLGLIRRVAMDLDFEMEGRVVRLNLHYYHLTFLGVNFCKVCSRPRLLKLERIDDANQRRKIDAMRKGAEPRASHTPWDR